MADVKPTRAEMTVILAEEAAEARRNAQALIDGLYPDQRRRGQREMDAVVIPIETTVVELRKSCAGCHDFVPPSGGYSYAYCRGLESDCIPDDGTGYCHAWAAKAAK